MWQKYYEMFNFHIYKNAEVKLYEINFITFLHSEQLPQILKFLL